MKRRDLERHLKNHKCELHHHGARHDYWINMRNGNRAPVMRHTELKKGTALAVCKQLGVPRPDKL